MPVTINQVVLKDTLFKRFSRSKTSSERNEEEERTATGQHEYTVAV